MKIRCIIIDDEPIACQGMQEYISQVEFLELAGTFENALQACPVLNDEVIDLIFLDIEMPGLSGIDFIRSLKKMPYTILTTAYPGYAVESYELGVIDYLVKPIPFLRFLKAANKVKDLFSANPGQTIPGRELTDYFFVKEDGRFTRIRYEEVLFVEAMQNYVAIHLPGRKLISYITLSLLERQLPASMFMRIHKSYIVPLGKITAIEANMAIIGQVKIPVSRKMKDQLIQRVLENNLLKR